MGTSFMAERLQVVLDIAQTSEAIELRVSPTSVTCELDNLE